MIRIKFTLLIIFFASYSFGQFTSNNLSIDVATIHDSTDIMHNCKAFADVENSPDFPPGLFSSEWRPAEQLLQNKTFENSGLSKTIYLKFSLRNSADSAVEVFLNISTFVGSMQVYKILAGNRLTQIPNNSHRNGFQNLLVAPRASETLLVKFYYRKSNLGLIKPILVRDDYVVKLQKLKHFKTEGVLVIGYVLSGLLLMMVFFTGLNYILTKRIEFLYNCCYSICMFLLIFFQTFLERKGGVFGNFFYQYLGSMLLFVGTVFYIVFTREFLQTKTNFPVLHKLFLVEEKIVIFTLICFTFIVFFTKYYGIQTLLENFLKLFILLIGIVYIIMALLQQNPLMNYLAIGSSLLIFFSVISFVVMLLPIETLTFYNSSIIYYEFGIVSELIFFLLGLAHKNRTELIEKIKGQEQWKLEAEKLSFENKLAVLNAQQTERNRISADMHDDLGAGVTAIRLYSELAKKRLGDEKVPEIEKISSFANDLLNNMNAIIWTMSSSNDSFHNMVAYIRSYAQEYFENTGIDCHIQIEENLPNIAVSGQIRRNIFLVVKEALNNVLKHSSATDVWITLKREKNGLTLNIQDNGKGIDFEKIRRFGNGLINMKKRMQEMQILFTIENNNGTLVTLHTTVDF